MSMVKVEVEVQGGKQGFFLIYNCCDMAYLVDKPPLFRYMSTNCQFDNLTPQCSKTDPF